MAFLDNTIYTNHALRKICENLAGDYKNFNFLKIKIGSGDNTLSLDRTDISEFLYKLDINEVVYNDGVLTIRCEIPPELADVPITEIGLFDTFFGIDYLFSYSKVEIVKPADLNYELTVVLNLGPRTIDFPGINEFYINKPEYATRDELNDFIDMTILIDTDLERIVRKNAEVIGYNKPEVTYERQLDIIDSIKDSTYTNMYYNLYNKYGDQLSDLFFVGKPNYLAYDINNYANRESYLTTYLDLYESNKDGFTFHKGPVTMMWCTKLNDITTESTVFNKKDNTNLYFSVDIVQNYEIFKISKPTPESVAEYDRALYNEMVITLYGTSGSYTITYVFDELNKGKYLGRYTPYMLSFNGDFNNPDFHMFVDGEEPERYNAPTEFDSVEEQEARKESDLYGKVIYGNPLQLVNMPDYGDMCHLKNYVQNVENGQKVNYYNAKGNNIFLTLKKQVTKYDVAFLSNIMSSLGEIGT